MAQKILVYMVGVLSIIILLSQNQAAARDINLNQKYDLSEQEIENLSKQGENGNDTSQRRLYEYYKFMGDNEEKSLYWLKKSAANGNNKSQFELGNFLLGIYVECCHDRKGAIYWYKKAYDNGNLNAKKYVDNWINDEDLAEIRSKALKGEKGYSYRLYFYYREINYDFKEKEYWLKRAAEEGNSDAQFDYYIRLKACHGAPDEAFYWLEEAAKNGNSEALKVLDKMSIKK